ATAIALPGQHRSPAHRRRGLPPPGHRRLRRAAHRAPWRRRRALGRSPRADGGQHRGARFQPPVPRGSGMNEAIQQGLAVLAVLSDPATWARVLRAAVYLVLGFLVSRAARFGLQHALRHLEKGQRLMLARFASYGVMTLFAISALRQFGMDFTVLLGAVGIV